MSAYDINSVAVVKARRHKGPSPQSSPASIPELRQERLQRAQQKLAEQRTRALQGERHRGSPETCDGTKFGGSVVCLCSRLFCMFPVDDSLSLAALLQIEVLCSSADKIACDSGVY